MLKIVVVLLIFAAVILAVVRDQRFKQALRASYWPIICLLRRCPHGASVLYVAVAMDVPSDVVYTTLRQLHQQGYATCCEDADDQPYQQLYQLSPTGIALIERNKWRLQQMHIYPA